MEIRNNVQSPNFGMALRIAKSARKGLEKSSQETIAKLEKVGQELKDTKFYHVEIGDDLRPKMTSSNDAYFGPFHNDKHSAIKGIYADSLVIKDTKGTLAQVAQYSSNENKNMFNVWSKEDIDIEKLSQIAKILDENAVTNYGKTNAAKKAHLEQVGKLLDQYGV